MHSRSKYGDGNHESHGRCSAQQQYPSANSGLPAILSIMISSIRPLAADCDVTAIRVSLTRSSGRNGTGVSDLT